VREKRERGKVRKREGGREGGKDGGREGEREREREEREKRDLSSEQADYNAFL
jgi:hypothetical protein